MKSMGIFAGLNDGDDRVVELDPAKIFRKFAKANDSIYRMPWDIQTEVWDKWFRRRFDRDSVIKMNTGSGKTVVGLMLLQSCLNELKEPCAYFTPNKQLQQQVLATASDLGVQVATDLDDPNFLRGKSILVAPIHKLFNGQSRFGIRSRSQHFQQCGAILVDDVHASMDTIRDCYSIKIESGDKCYAKLLKLFESAIKGQSIHSYSAITSGEESDTVQVPYWDWQQLIERVETVLDSNLPAETRRFGFSMVRQHLSLCEAFVNRDEFEIRLPYPDLELFPSYVDADRRIFMTATLTDDSSLCASLGVERKAVEFPIAPKEAGDIGDRIILAPSRLSKVRKEQVQNKLKEWSTRYNVVVLVPSFNSAEDWRWIADKVAEAGEVSEVVARLRNEHVGLVVLVNRYDGVDLPDDACRILVIDGLPQYRRPHSIVEQAVLNDSDALSRLQMQRVEQGMGRGVRSSDDYCAVLLLGPHLIYNAYKTGAKENFSPATRAQFELSERFSESITKEHFRQFVEAVEAFLDRDPEWVEASHAALAKVEYPERYEINDWAIVERLAFDDATSQQGEEAATRLKDAVKALPRRERGFYEQRAAAYMNTQSPKRAIGIQRSARVKNKFLLKRGDLTKAKRSTISGAQSKRALDFLESKKFETRDDFKLWGKSVLCDLVPDPAHGSSASFEAAVEAVGCLLGFDSTRPENESNVGPDNLWRSNEGPALLLEAKSESEAERISRRDLSQCAHSVDWFASTFGQEDNLGVLVHGSNCAESNAVPRKNLQVFTFEKLEKFRENVSNYVEEIAKGWGSIDEGEIESLIQLYDLGAGKFRQNWLQDVKG